MLFDPNGNVKLIDFNLSARIMYRGVLGWNKLETHCGTLVRDLCSNYAIFTNGFCN